MLVYRLMKELAMNGIKALNDIRKLFRVSWVWLGIGYQLGGMTGLLYGMLLGALIDSFLDFKSDNLK